MSIKSKYTQEQLEAAFDQVKDQKDWKKPIHKLVDYPGAENVDCAVEAIIFFTGSIPETTRCKNCDKILFVADGYYRTLGG